MLMFYSFKFDITTSEMGIDKYRCEFRKFKYSNCDIVQFDAYGLLNVYVRNKFATKFCINYQTLTFTMCNERDYENVRYEKSRVHENVGKCYKLGVNENDETQRCDFHDTEIESRATLGPQYFIVRHPVHHGSRYRIHPPRNLAQISTAT